LKWGLTSPSIPFIRFRCQPPRCPSPSDPIYCRRCLTYGQHVTRTCPNEQRCRRCGGLGHSDPGLIPPEQSPCNAAGPISNNPIPTCLHCGGRHLAGSASCPTWVSAKQSQLVEAPRIQRPSRPPHQVEQHTPKSYRDATINDSPNTSQRDLRKRLADTLSELARCRVTMKRLISAVIMICDGVDNVATQYERSPLAPIGDELKALGQSARDLASGLRDAPSQPLSQREAHTHAPDYDLTRAPENELTRQGPNTPSKRPLSPRHSTQPRKKQNNTSSPCSTDGPGNRMHHRPTRRHPTQPHAQPKH
jgi:hypothetical protein